MSIFFLVIVGTRRSCNQRGYPHPRKLLYRHGQPSHRDYRRLALTVSNRFSLLLSCCSPFQPDSLALCFSQLRVQGTSTTLVPDAYNLVAMLVNLGGMVVTIFTASDPDTAALIHNGLFHFSNSFQLYFGYFSTIFDEFCVFLDSSVWSQ